MATKDNGSWWLPKPKFSEEITQKFFQDPEIISLEILFVSLTVIYVFVMWGIMQWVWPVPIFVTWSQLFTGFLMAWIFGEAGRDFPSSAFFPPLELSREIIIPLMLPILSYLFMSVYANYIFMCIPGIAYYPVIAALAVASHHATR